MQGFNMGRYIPPAVADAERTPAFNRDKHPLGARARKLASQGALTVRFEMPFAVWCAHCAAPTLIGQGVRFNAAKRRVGSYYSTPVWAFTLKHAVCGGLIEIRTDPKNAEYVVVSGARRRDYGGGAGEGEIEGGEAGTGVILTERERAEMRQSAFGKLERTIADRERLEVANRRIEELLDVADRQWDDPYAQNQRLRKAFRAGRHERERQAAKADELKERMGLGIELLPEAEEDAKRAGLVDFGSVAVEDDAGVDKVLARPLFAKATAAKQDTEDRGGPAKRQGKLLKSEIAASRTRESLVSEIVSNTRAARDPFLDFGSRESTTKGPVRLPGLKRKREAEEGLDPPRPIADEGQTPKAAAGTAALVSYASDSD
ncbi:77b1d26b-16bd-4100-8be2-743a3ce0b5de [Thermothielavioides terrestris]|uniref:Uncharacterized protein n=2 Tax=Thermothielavioides terrestris TaxID=2587410 RepID=G2QRB4_THETT|nr:uncharacterized protein THITE_2110034 [Thermothielavioides terrestris NRRL 8126]AEO64166.1 hypothetical protein THITE_2110034 [Thermothielavioides terrestris NRRL 8126]SPQ26977.1 77b1d26b-16bd-4100-8be2-743a3ce0b5de [Thermothielavioides terrestris]